MAEKQVYICCPQRTPFGSFQGSLASISAPKLAAHCIRSIISKSKLMPEAIDEVILGCVLTAGQGQAPARQAVLGGGLSTKTQALTVNKVCSSGLKAVMLAANDVQLGHAEVVLAGGMESMSQAPYLLSALRAGARLGHSQAEDSIIKDGLWDVYRDYHMGSAAELCASTYMLSREAQDSFATESYRRAQAAQKSGIFTDEISPIEVASGKTTIVVSDDEEPGKTDFAKIPKLKPVFQKDGTVTAANASSINDGACVMIVASEDAVKKYHLQPLGRIVSQGWAGQEPEWFTTAPVAASRHALSRAGKSIQNIDLIEVNEAFAAVALAYIKDLELDTARVNINGGAVALGHPIGASGARILGTLLYALRRAKKTYGLVSICNGGGEATAMVVEGLS